MSGLLASLQQLPTFPFYVVLGVLAAVENFFPFVPADVVVAFAAFLAGRGVLSPWMVFGVGWAASFAGSAALFLSARRYGPRFLEGPLGRRLVPQSVVVHVRHAYERHGPAGIFLARLMPVWQVVVPPFAGAIGLPPAGALLPIALASALWYGALTLAVSRLATSFDAVLAALAKVDRSLLLVAIMAFLAVAWTLRRRLQR